MEMHDEVYEGVAVLNLSGRLDASATRVIKDKVKMLTGDKHLNLVIDLGGIDFIDSSGLGVLVASLRTVNKIGGDIKISSLQDQVRSIFELTRLHHLFEIFDDRVSAAKSF